MRIAYITPYQGPTLIERRPIVRNRSMSNRIKIELIATMLRAKSHDVEMICQGEVIENAYKFYPAFSEQEKFHPEIPIFYASAFPVRRLNGFWSSMQTLAILKRRHQVSPFDLVIIFNMKSPQIACAKYAMQRLDIPIILEYEDDVFVNVMGEESKQIMKRHQCAESTKLLRALAGGIAVSPHLLSQFPPGIPRILLRGVVGDDLVDAASQVGNTKKNWVLFSGTHIESNGVAELIEAWASAAIPGWELHITGYGQLTEALKEKARNKEGIFFHGLVPREEFVHLLGSAKICINPHAVSHTPGNVFAFKIIEYLAAGAHVITTPMGTLESDFETGITYMPDNSPATIASTLAKVIRTASWGQKAAEHVRAVYSSSAVAKSLDELVRLVASNRTAKQPDKEYAA